MSNKPNPKMVEWKTVQCIDKNCATHDKKKVEKSQEAIKSELTPCFSMSWTEKINMLLARHSTKPLYSMSELPFSYLIHLIQ